MNGQNELTSAGSTTEQESVTAEQQYDAAFAELREAVKTKFEELITGGVRLFRVDEARFELKDLLAITPDSLKAHYQCQSCSGFLRRFSPLGYMNDDGSVNSVFFDALQGVKYFSERLEDQMPGFFSLIGTAIRRAKPVPVAKLNYSFSKAESYSPKADEGTFTHLHGSSEFLRQSYNAVNVTSSAMKRGEAVYKNIRETFISGEKIIELQARLEKEIHHPEAVGLLTPYAGLLEHVRAMKTNQVRYLASLLMTSDYKWLNSIEGTIAGNVLEALRDPTNTAENIGERLTMLVRKLKARTAPGVYKEKTVESSDGLIETTVKLLKEKGWENALARTIPSVDEVPMKWRPTPIVVKEKAEEAPVSALDAAAGKLLKNKPEAKAAGIEEGISSFISEPTVAGGMSLEAFNDRLGEYAKIELSFSGAPLYPVLVTAPADGKAYPELFKYTLVKDAQDLGMLAVMLVNPVSPAFVEAALQGRAAHPRANEAKPFADAQDGSFYELTGYMAEGPNGSRAMLRGIADYFAHNFEDGGGLLLGVNITQAYFHMARGLIDLSRKMPMGYKGKEVSDGAGALAVTIGMLFRCTKHNGTVEMIRITSSQ